MAAFLIETAKALLTFIAVCVGLGVLYLVFVVVREVGWIVKQENRRKYEQEGKENGNGSIYSGVPVRDWGHGSNRSRKDRSRSENGILSASGHGSSCGGYGINTHGHGHFNNALSEKRQNSIQI